jgi:hypothetical protein
MVAKCAGGCKTCEDFINSSGMKQEQVAAYAGYANNSCGSGIY